MRDRPNPSRRSAPRWLVLPVLSGLLAACGSGQPARRETLTDATLSYVDQSQGATGGRYRSSSRDARRDLADAVRAVAESRLDDARRLLDRQGYRIRELGDVRLLVPAELPDGRGWGLYAVRPAGLPVAVEVPHPRADLDTERVGAELAERLGARYLLVAGARRDRDGGDADVAHRAESVFAAVHAMLAEQGVPAVQVHGFAQDSSPGNDVVVSPGSAALSPLVLGVADMTAGAGLRTCRVRLQECGRLEGRTNAQARASAETDADFVHLELAPPLRENPERRRVVVDAVARAVTGAAGPPS